MIDFLIGLGIILFLLYLPGVANLWKSKDQINAKYQQAVRDTRRLFGDRTQRVSITISSVSFILELTFIGFMAHYFPSLLAFHIVSALFCLHGTLDVIEKSGNPEKHRYSRLSSYKCLYILVYFAVMTFFIGLQ